jgi:integrase
MARYRKKPLVQLEFGTRIYAPSSGEDRYRVVATDAVSGERIFVKCQTEAQARSKAREVEQFISQHAPLRDPGEQGSRTVGRLAARYVDEHLSSLSLRYGEKQTYLLRRWVLPRLSDRVVTAWTPAESAALIAAVRRAGGSDSTVQDVGAVMRALVTHARRLRWLTSQSEDPMWMVHYSKSAAVQGNTALYVARASLPTDEQCEALFRALEQMGEHRWALAMRLAHRSGLRWGELIGLQPADVDVTTRVVHVRRAVEQPASGPPSLKLPKNGRTRTAIFPKSLANQLSSHVDSIEAQYGPTGLLFPSATGRIARRATFQTIWIRAANAAGWPMTSPLRRSRGYGQKNKGWRWTGAAKWTPHDLRHIAACWMLFDLKLDPAVVADKLGHADPAFTIKRYVGIRGDANALAMLATEDW